MHSVATKSGAKTPFGISGVEPGFQFTKLAAVVRGALTLAVLSALLLTAARPAQAQTYETLYSFTGTSDGSEPASRLTLNNGNLYGTTYSGGLGYGTVFELTPNGSGGWTQTTLYSFCPVTGCADGQNPTYSYVMFDSQGNLYGTAFGGGASGYGVVFKLTASGGTWTESVIHSFANAPDGANPVNGLIMDTTGNLYGTTYAGGTGAGNGCVFELSPSGNSWTEQIIYDINSTYAGLTMDSTGNIYGTTYGSIFELKPNGSGGWVSNVLYSFTPANSATEGSDPNGTLVLDSLGNLYGTTLTGGANNAGVVFGVGLVKATGKWAEKVLFSFGGNAQFGPNGATPFAGIVFDSKGNIYGTTKAGGQKGAGTVYELAAPAGGKGGYKEHVVLNFNGENGAVPLSGLIIDSSGYLYGTTYGGGANGQGSVFVTNAHATPTTTGCTSSVNPSTLGQAVTLTGTVSSTIGPPTDGDVVVFEPVGQSNTTGGVATFVVSDLKAGQTKITCVFDGDLNFIGSRSTSFFQVVNK